MGSTVGPSDVSPRSEESDEEDVRLGDLLAGRLSDIDVDSVAAVRDQRESL